MRASIGVVKSIISLGCSLETLQDTRGIEFMTRLSMCEGLMKNIESLMNLLRPLETNLYYDCLECKSYSEMKDLLTNWYITLDEE